MRYAAIRLSIAGKGVSPSHSSLPRSACPIVTYAFHDGKFISLLSLLKAKYNFLSKTKCLAHLFGVSLKRPSGVQDKVKSYLSRAIRQGFQHLTFLTMSWPGNDGDQPKDILDEDTLVPLEWGAWTEWKWSSIRHDYYRRRTSSTGLVETEWQSGGVERRLPRRKRRLTRSLASADSHAHTLHTPSFYDEPSSSRTDTLMITSNMLWGSEEQCSSSSDHSNQCLLDSSENRFVQPETRDEQDMWSLPSDSSCRLTPSNYRSRRSEPWESQEAWSPTSNRTRQYRPESNNDCYTEHEIPYGFSSTTTLYEHERQALNKVDKTSRRKGSSIEEHDDGILTESH